MDMHTTGVKPDWENIKPSEQSAFQRVARETHGVVTPANAVSLAGLALVVDGSRRLLSADYHAGIPEIGVGRVLDLVDGVVANKTGTKSPLRAGVDAVFDKVGMVVGLSAIAQQSLAPKPVIVAHLAQNAANAAITMSAKKNGVVLNPSQEGKWAMAAQGLGIGLHTIARGLLKGRAKYSLEAAAYSVDGVAIYFGIVATKGYLDEARG